jgi:hypothetical protein
MLWKRLNPRAETEFSFQGAMHVAMGMLGWLLPDTHTVVKATSPQDEEISAELPDELKDPFAVLDRDRENPTQRLEGPQNRDAAIDPAA